MLKETYQSLFDYAEELHIQDLSSREEGGKLYIKGMAPYQYEKNLFWDKLKTFADWKGQVAADIRVINTDIFGYYTVQPGDTLSKIAKWHLGNAMKYMDIFNINTDILQDPNVIKVGQKLKLPHPE
ncbi:MAG: LysM peptidoglycan-binding domain-containing protein [Acidobacteria bacterium]|nr:LysM peptidoglycan-binding domain-containing protein [Acidobacteriota bacterium]